MNMRHLLLGLSMLTSAAAMSQGEITYTERDGVMWITPKYIIATYAMKPLSSVPEFQCQRAEDFLNKDEVLKQCRKDIDSCDGDTIELLRAEARRLSFGDTYDDTGKIADYSIVDWKIGKSEMDGLDPKRLEEYASRLSIDPMRSVVAKLQRSSMVLTTDPGKLLFFKGHIEEEDMSNSWFLQNKLAMLPMGDYADTFIGTSAAKRDAINIRGTFLNCDIATKGDYIDVAYSGTMVGHIPITKQSEQVLWQSYDSLRALPIPENMESIEQAVLYGYELARTTTGLDSQRIDANYIIKKLFNTSDGQIRLKDYASKGELSSELSKAATYKESGSLVRLVRGRASADITGDAP